MKILQKIFHIFCIILLFGTLQVHAQNDKDHDSIIDEKDTQETFYNVITDNMKKFFETSVNYQLYNTNNGQKIGNVVAFDYQGNIVILKNNQREIIDIDAIGSSRVDAFKNKKSYFKTNIDTYKVIQESQIIQYICLEDDINSNKYNCGDLGSFSERKFYSLSQIDTDNDGIKNFDSNGDILDTEETELENKNYVCTQGDINNQNDKYPNDDEIIETIGYGCTQGKLGTFSAIKKSYFIDSDNDGIKDFEDKEINTTPENKNYICTKNDINQNKYSCADNNLGKFSAIKKSYFIDSDNDGIKDFEDKEINTASENKNYICTKNDIQQNKYSCSDNNLGKFSTIKKSYFIDSDNDGVKDFEDKEINTASENKNYICTKNDIDQNKYSCSQYNLGGFSGVKQSYFVDSDKDGVKDFEDLQKFTPVNKSKYICTQDNISKNQYGCSNFQLGVYSQQKEKGLDITQFEDFDDGGSSLFEGGGTQSNSDNNLKTEDGTRLNNNSGIDNKKLDDFQNGGISVSQGGEIGTRNALLRIAKDLKNVFFFIASLYFLIIILKLIVSDKTEEEVSNFKKGGLWITIGLIVTQVSYVFVEILFDKGVSEQLAGELAEKIFEPFIKLLETGASFFFIAIAVYAFYKLVTSGGNEDAAKEGKMSIVYAILGFILAKITKIIVYTTYGKIDYTCEIDDILETNKPGDRADCLHDQDIDGFAEMIVNLINWANGFVGVIVVILIIYAGAKILLSRGEEESLTKAKSILLYIFIGIGILILNYLILTFFLVPENPITGA